MFVETTRLNTPGTMTVCTAASGESVPVLFVKFGSNVAENADAMLVRKPMVDVDRFVSTKLNGLELFVCTRFVEPSATGVTVKTRLVACPLASTGNTGHVTTLLETTPPPEAVPKTRFVGSTSCASVLIAGEGPAFVTTIV